MENFPNVLTAKDISKRLGIGYNKALRFIQKSGVPYIKINNTYRVMEDVFFEWLHSPDGQKVEL